MSKTIESKMSEKKVYEPHAVLNNAKSSLLQQRVGETS